MTDRRKFKQDEIEDTWNKAESISGKNPELYRQDKVGNIIYYHSYGKDSAMGWDVDHSKPLCEGGTYHKNNLQVLQAAQNRYDKNGTYPYNYNTEAQGVTRYDLIQTPIDKRSSAVKSGAVLFNYDGSIDQRSAAVRSGDVKLTKDGNIDKRCSAYKSGSIMKF
jgi:hypothetical protein